MAQRDDIRNAILGGNHFQSKVVTLFGQEIEIRQASLGSLMADEGESDKAHKAARMLVKYCYVPGTNEHVFDEADIEAILQLPWDKSLGDVQKAITDLLGINIEEQVKN